MGHSLPSITIAALPSTTIGGLPSTTIGGHGGQLSRTLERYNVRALHGESRATGVQRRAEHSSFTRSVTPSLRPSIRARDQPERRSDRNATQSTVHDSPCENLGALKLSADTRCIIAEARHEQRIK